MVQAVPDIFYGCLQASVTFGSMLISCAKPRRNVRFLLSSRGEGPDLSYFTLFVFLSMFIIPFLKVISELRYFCFNAFYNVTVLHYNSILWEELLRNKKKNLLCGQTVHSQTGSVSVCLRVTLTKEILRSYSNPKVKENIYI